MTKILLQKLNLFISREKAEKKSLACFGIAQRIAKEEDGIKG